MRKDWRDKTLSGYFMGYSTEGEMGYKIYVPELKSVVVGVNCVFNEVIPTYYEEYFQELNKMQFETLKTPSNVENFVHLIGIKYIDDESGLEFETTRIAIYQGLIVGYRAPVLLGGKLGKEEKSPIHVADIVQMCGASTSSTTEGPDSGRHIRGILKQGVPLAAEALSQPKLRSAEESGNFPKKGKVRFELQESDQNAGPVGSRRTAGAHNSPNLKISSGNGTMRSAHDTKLPSKNKIEFDALHDTISGLNRSNDRQEFAEELPPSRIVTRYDANSSEEAVDRPVDQMNPIIPERDSTTVGVGIDTFVSHKWDKSKRMILPRNVTNVSTLGNVYTTTDKQALGEEEQHRAAEAGSKDEVAQKTTPKHL